MSKEVKKYGRVIFTLGVILVIVAMYLVAPISQASTQIANREIKISDSRPGETSVTYDFEGDHSATDVKCLEIEFCDAASGSCVAPTGMDASTAEKGTEGDWAVWTYSGWLIGTSLTVNKVYYYHATGEGSVLGTTDRSFSFNVIKNPTGANPYYARVKTYDAGAAGACSGTVIDEGIVAFAILSGVAVSATVAESLSFAADDYDIGFGTWSTTELRWATADPTAGATTEPAVGLPTQLTLSTNAAGGATITIKDIGNGTDAAGLWKSTATTNLIAAVAANPTTPPVGGGTEGYAAYGKNASSLTIDEGFNNDVTSPLAISRDLQTFATAAGAVSGAYVDLALKAAIAGDTPAGSYADTIILVCTPLY